MRKPIKYSKVTAHQPLGSDTDLTRLWAILLGIVVILFLAVSLS